MTIRGEWHPGLLGAILDEVEVVGVKQLRHAMVVLANAIEKQAKVNASSGAHKRGTPTPARRGSGPARITGTLVRSITHTRLSGTVATGYETRVGLAAGHFPKDGRTASSRYGLYLETRIGYPFLLPAFHFVVRVVAPGVWRRELGEAAWRRHLP